MKRTISILLALLMTLSLAVPALAKEGEETYHTIDVEYSDRRGMTESLNVMLRGGHVYADAKALAERLGYSFGESDEGAVIYNRDPSNGLPPCLTRFEYGSTRVSHMLFSRLVDDYVAPFASVKNDKGSWIPFEYSLPLLNSGPGRIDEAKAEGTILIDVPSKNIIDRFYDIMKNTDRYGFDWADDFGYTDADVTALGATSHLINVFSGLLDFDGPSWKGLFDTFAWNTASYDAKYSEKLALLICTESDDELEETKKDIELLVDWLSEDGNVGKWLKAVSDELDSEVGDLSSKCEEILKRVRSSNTSLASYNKSYQSLEKALGKQTWFTKIGGNTLELQKGITGATGKTLGFLGEATKLLELAGFAQEFQNQDSFSRNALAVCLNDLEEGSELQKRMRQSMTSHTEWLSGSVDGYMINRLVENAHKWILDELPLHKFIGTEASGVLLAWNLSKEVIPFIKDGLKGADNFELALYAQVFQADSFLNYQRMRNAVFNEGEITKERLYQLSQRCYAYLKSCYVTREAALESLEAKSNSTKEKITPLIKQQREINSEIAEVLVELKRSREAVESNRNDESDNEEQMQTVFGFLPEDNAIYLKDHNDDELVKLIESSAKSTSPEEGNAHGEHSNTEAADTENAYGGVYRAVIDEWRQRISYDKTVERGQENVDDWRYSVSPRYVSMETGKTGDNFVYCYHAFDGFDTPMLIVADPDDDYKVYGCYQHIPETETIAIYTSHFRHCKWLCEDGTFRAWTNAPADGGYYRFYYAERPIGCTEIGDGVYTIEFATLENFVYGSNSMPGEYSDLSGNKTSLAIEDGRAIINEHYPAATNVTWNRIM